MVPGLLESGGEELLVEVCKSAYLEIYYPQARALGLDRDGELLARFAGWEERNLAELYRRWHRPNPLPVVTPEAVKAHYERNPEQFTFGATVDLEVLFVRCEGSEKAWQVCRERMRSHQSRAGQGESLKTLLVEERERSGEANGSFAEIAPARLFPGLRAAVEDAEPGTFTNLVESAEGIFWVRVLARRDENVLPLERVERRIRRELTAELYDGWSQEEIDRLRSLRAESSTNNLAEDALFAQAARREGLAREPSFLKQRDTFWRWQLADAAFFRDLEVFPADEELASDRGVQLYREQVYLLATFHETGDSETTGKVSDKVAAGLAVANDPAAFLRAEAARYPNAIVETVGPLTRRELRRLDAELHDRSAELAPGQWTGALPTFDRPRSGGIPAAHLKSHAVAGRGQAGASARVSRAYRRQRRSFPVNVRAPLGVGGSSAAA